MTGQAGFFHAVILAGGMGTRLSDLAKETPKSMLEVNGKPVLQHQIENLKTFGITKITLVIGHLGYKIQQYFDDGRGFGVDIEYFVERSPLGTAGAFYYLKESMPEEFIVIYGDLIFDLDFSKLIQFHRTKQAFCTLTVHPNDHPYDSDLLILDHHQSVQGILRKNEERNFYYSNCVNAGIFIFNKKIFDHLKKDLKQDLEKNVIAPLLPHKQILGYKTTEYIKDMGTPHRYQRVLQQASDGIIQKRNLALPQQAIFLDRDGTINKHVGLLYRPEQLEISDQVCEAIGKINQSKFLAIVITNQSVIARNLCTLDELDNIHRKLETDLGKRNVYIDDLFYCPHHPDSGYPEENKAFKLECNCRKPKTGMIDAAVKKYHIDLTSSFFIGDTLTDLQTGKNATLKTIILRSRPADFETGSIHADFYAEDLNHAVTQILKGSI